MNLSKKLIEETVETTAGRDVVPLVNALKNKKNVSEFLLANQIKKDINATRNMLYRLYNQNLVSSTRKKDKRKGWYVYYWTLNTNRMRYLAKQSKELYLNKILARLEKEKNMEFYACSNKCVRLDFEKSTELNFKCPECGDLLNIKDNKEIIEELEKELRGQMQKIKN